MKRAEDVKGNLIGDECIGGCDDSDPSGSENEDETLAVDIGNATPEQEKATKG